MIQRHALLQYEEIQKCKRFKEEKLGGAGRTSIEAQKKTFMACCRHWINNCFFPRHHDITLNQVHYHQNQYHSWWPLEYLWKHCFAASEACFKCKFENYPIFRIYYSANLLLCPFKTNVFKRAAVLYNSKLKDLCGVLHQVLLIFLIWRGL